MKSILRNLFTPLLNIFESGEEAYNYKKSHRVILIVAGCLFLLLSAGALFAVISASLMGGLIPFVVFLLVGLVCVLVGSVGSDRAVAKIWSSR